MKVLFSIKPEYVHQILDGTKKFEYRRTIFSKKDIQRMVIYSTLPEGRVVAEVQIKRILSGTKTKIWERTKKFSGISKDDFLEYFSGKETVYAIELGEIHKFEEPKMLNDYVVKVAPQSFVYIR